MNNLGKFIVRMAEGMVFVAIVVFICLMAFTIASHIIDYLNSFQ